MLNSVGRLISFPLSCHRTGLSVVWLNLGETAVKQHPKPGCWRGESLTVAHHSHHDLITFYLLQQETWTCRMNLKMDQDS